MSQVHLFQDALNALQLEMQHHAIPTDSNLIIGKLEAQLSTPDNKHYFGAGTNQVEAVLALAKKIGQK